MSARTLSSRLALGLLLPLAPLAAQAPDSTALRPIEVSRSAVDLHGPARPGSYVSAVGRRSLAMGSELGGFEVWAWPLKLLHNFELRFQTPLFQEPIPARTLARSVTITPAGPVITYTHPAFTVRQTVFAVRNEPAIVMLLDVDAVRPLEILAEFVSDLELAWPGAIGGQYVFWDQGEKAFVLSESQRKASALVGSPFTTSATNQPAHDVPDAPNQLRIAVGDPSRTPMPRPGEPAGRLTNLHVRGIPIVIAGALAPRDTVKAIYRRVLAEIPRLYAERVAAAQAVLDGSLSVESPDPRFDLAVRWAALNLDEAMACNPDLGCGLVAGYGPSEPRGARPGFGWYFGGDASINSLGIGALGQYDLARDGLEFFVKYQRPDGKIPHEISQSAGRIRWFEDYPYAFYHADTTPYWLLAWGDYWKATSDTTTIRRVWPAIRKAFDWCRGTVDSTTGLMLNSKGGLGAVEVGDLGVGVESDIYLSAVWVEALDRMARMAEVMERKPARRNESPNRPIAQSPLVAQARQLHARALTSLRERFWLPAEQMYAFALLERGEIRPELTVWPTTAMSFGLFEPERGMLAAQAQARAALTTDWGARSLSSGSRLFDPLHYNNGTVWPFVTGFAALAQYRYRNPTSGFQLLQSIVRSGWDRGLGRNPEVYAGLMHEPLETAVPQQFFGTSFIATVLVRGLLGWEPDLPAGTVRLAPQLPIEWDRLAVKNAPAGENRYSLSVQRSSTRLEVTLRRTAGARPLTLEFAPRLPLGAVVRRATATGAEPAPCGAPEATARDATFLCRVPFTDSTRFVIEYDPGYEVLLPPAEVPRGASSRQLRLLDQRLVQDTLALVLEGSAGSTSPILVRRSGSVHPLVVFPEPGDSVDGYSRTELRVHLPATP